MPKSSKFFLGALLGAAAVALLTPVTGKKARSVFSKAAKSAGIPTDKIKSAFDDLSEKGEELLGKASSSKTKNKK